MLTRRRWKKSAKLNQLHDGEAAEAAFLTMQWDARENVRPPYFVGFFTIFRMS